MAFSDRLKGWLLNPWLVLLGIAVAVGVAVFVAQNQAANANANGGGNSDGMGGQGRSVPVAVAPVRAMTLSETVRGVGTLRAFETVEVRSEVAGRIHAIHFEEGGDVEEGQLLFEIDDQKLQRELAARQATLRAAQVRVANAERTFERQQQLHERGVVSPDEFDRAEAELDSARAEQERAEAELALIEQQLEDTRILAPFSGQISERQVDRGTYVAVGDHLATLYQSDPIEIGFSLPERYVGRVRRGQDVEVMVAAYPDQPFEGVVQFISPSVDQATRTFRVRARVPNPDLQLKPGAFATAVVTIGVRESRPVVPAESLVATRRGYMVFIIEDGQAVSREVRTGLRRDGAVEILEGLSLGEQVVRTGHLRLTGGETVTVTNESEDDLAHGAQ